MITDMPFLFVQVGFFTDSVRLNASLRTIAEQFSVNTKDLCDIDFISALSIRTRSEHKIDKHEFFVFARH